MQQWGALGELLGGLTGSEKRRFIWFVAEYLFLVEKLHRQHQAGFLSTASWQQHERAVAGLLLNPALAAWWESGIPPFSEQYVECIDAAREEPADAVWSYTAVTKVLLTP